MGNGELNLRENQRNLDYFLVGSAGPRRLRLAEGTSERESSCQQFVDIPIHCAKQEKTVNGNEKVTTWDDAEELLTASKFGDVVRRFGSLNDLAKIG